MFKLTIKKEIAINKIQESQLIDVLGRLSFLMNYRAISCKEGAGLILSAGTVMSLNPNSVKHTINVDYSKMKDGALSLEATASVFPWEKSKMREILSYRVAQFINYLYSQGIAAEIGATASEKETAISPAPFTHLAERKIYGHIASFLKVLAGMFLCIVGVVLAMWIYGILIIGVKNSRLFFEVAFGSYDAKNLVGGGSVIGIAIGYAVGMILSVYFALSEAFEFLNKRILSFGIFYALLLCFFIIEEEAFLITALIALCIPFLAYSFYYMAWGLKKVYIKAGDK